MRTLEEVAKDGRYTTGKEFCGHKTALYVARFCMSYIGAYETKLEALTACLEHDRTRMGGYL